MSGDSGERIHPRHLSGVSNSVQFHAVDQSWDGLYAAAFSSLINIVKAADGTCVTVLSGYHTVAISILKFEPTSDQNFNSQPRSARLGSVDESGMIVIWDIHRGNAVSQVKTNALINDFCWVPLSLCKDMFTIIQGNKNS